MLKQLAERPTVNSGTVLVPIGMYSRQLIQGRGTNTAHMDDLDVVCMGRFGSVKGLSMNVCACLHAW